MERYRITCSFKEDFFKGIGEPGTVPIAISCYRKDQFDNIECCIILKKNIEPGEDWIPEIKFHKR